MRLFNSVLYGIRKVDGTNIRVMYDDTMDKECITFGGKTDRALAPKPGIKETKMDLTLPPDGYGYGFGDGDA